jgi:hypothetical protein
MMATTTGTDRANALSQGWSTSIAIYRQKLIYGVKDEETNEVKKKLEDMLEDKPPKREKW